MRLLNRRSFLLGISGLLIGVMFSACSAAKEEQTMFIQEGGKLKHDDRLPVNRVWKDPSAVMGRYHKIIIKDVRTDLQLKKAWYEHNGARALTGREEQDLQSLAAYMKNSFVKAFSAPGSRLKSVDSPGADTLCLELALVKVVADKPILETGTAVGAAFINPFSLLLIPVKSVVSHETKSPLCAYIAIEGKVRDSQSGKTLVLFTLNSHEAAALVDLKKFTSPYDNVKAVIDRWSGTLVDAANRRPLESNEKIVDSAEKGYSLIKL